MKERMMQSSSTTNNNGPPQQRRVVTTRKRSSAVFGHAGHINKAKRKERQRFVMILAAVSVFGMILHLNPMGQANSNNMHYGLRASAGRDGGWVPSPQHREQWINDKSQPFNEKNVAFDAKHLIVVAGHSVLVSGHLDDADVDEEDWYLLDYQKHVGMPEAIVGHITAGIEEAIHDKQSLLVFSGGETRGNAGPETEGSSYYRVADAMDLWHQTTGDNDVRARSTTEDYATDSLENLMFSICRFHEVTHHYPSEITVVSFTFKERRFRELHAKALRIPDDRFHFIGKDPPVSLGFDLEKAQHGEQENAAKPFEKDPYGCHSEILKQKRKARNPFARTPPYDLSCPEMRDLLHYCGPELIKESKVPWLPEK